VIETANSERDPVAEDAWSTVWLHGNWRYLTSQMTTPAKEMAADHVARWMAEMDAADRCPARAEPEELRWWRRCDDVANVLKEST
jgi:hypothetical protein